MKLLISLAAVLAASTPAFAEKPAKGYSLADLKTLVSQKAYQEAVSHLGDIGPSERNAEWLDIAATATSGYVADLSSDQAMYAITEIDRAFPQVLQSPKYTKVRAEQGLKGYEKCLGSSYGGGGCLEQATKFLDGDPSNLDLALKMAKIVRRSFTHYTAAPFFLRAVGGKSPGAACKDDDLRLALVSALSAPPEYDAAAAGRTLAGVCWNEQKKAVLDAFNEAAKGGSSYTRRNTCEVLKAKKALTADQTRICAKDKDKE